MAFACLVVRCLLCDVLGVRSTKGLKMIKRGDRVKLTARVAAAFNNSKRTHKFDWTDRRGVVERITTNKAAAMVLWDGRRRTTCRSAASNPDSRETKRPPEGGY